MASSESRAKLRAGLLLLFTLVTGIAIGVVCDRIVLVREQRIFPKEGMRFVTNRIADRLDRELDLSDAQRRDVDAVLNRHRHRVEAAWSNVRPQVQREVLLADREISALLTPEQRIRYAKMRRDLHSRATRMVQ